MQAAGRVVDQAQLKLVGRGVLRRALAWYRDSGVGPHRESAEGRETGRCGGEPGANRRQLPEPRQVLDHGYLRSEQHAVSGPRSRGRVVDVHSVGADQARAVLDQPARPGFGEVLGVFSIAGRSPALITTGVQEDGTGGDVEGR